MEPNQKPNKKGLIIALGCLIIVAVLITLGLRSSKQPTSSNPAPSPVVTAAWPSKAVKKEDVTDNSKTYQITAEYPDTSRDDITAIFKSFTDDQISTFKSNTANMPDGFPAVTLDISYDENANTKADNYIFHIYSDTGGAHGIEATKTFTFTSTGDQVKLADLFIDETKGLDLVSDYVKQDLMKRQFADTEWISDGAAPTEENYQNFTIDENGVTFMFDPYQVAAYSDGPQTVTVPVSAFKSEANPDLFK